MIVDPLKKSSKFSEMTARWSLVDAVLAGTNALRGSNAYMPRHPMETDESYVIRQSTHFLNVYKRTLESSVGQVLRDQLVVNGYTPDVLKFLESVNSIGQDLTEFARHVFKDALHHGVSYIVVDAPKINQPIRTLLDLSTTGFRPYWVQVHSTQVLAAYSATISGSERLVHFRYLEKTLDLTQGYQESYTERVRAYDLVDGQVIATVWTKVGDQWTVTDESTLSQLTQIPVIAVYSDRTGFYTGQPALEDLAEINIAHWNSASEQKHCLGVSRVPFLMIKGLPNEIDSKTGKPKEFVISPHKVLVSTSDNTDAKWVESTGSAITQGFKDLERLEAEMNQFGATFLGQQPGDETATAAALNAAAATNALGAYARSLMDSLEAAISVTAEFYGQLNISGTVNYAQPATEQTNNNSTEGLEQ